MNNEYLLYLKEIKDTSWVIEVISERFDNAINMMTSNSIIYGGVIRDCLAGKELTNNLDIAVPGPESEMLISRFVRNPKWVQIESKKLSTFCSKFNMSSLFSTDLGIQLDQAQSYRLPKLRKFSREPRITTFKTLGNKTVQIIVLDSVTDDLFQVVVTLSKHSSMVCNGVILTSDNKVFEVTPNAYADCKNHVLNFNTAGYAANVGALKLHIKDLCDCGWIDKINMNTVSRITKRNKLIEAKKHRNTIGKTYIKDKGNHVHSITDHPQDASISTAKFGGMTAPKSVGANFPHEDLVLDYTTELTYSSLTHEHTIPSDKIHHFGGTSRLIDFLYYVAKRYKLAITILKSEGKNIVFRTKNEKINRFVCDKLAENVKTVHEKVGVFSNAKASVAKANIDWNGAKHSETFFTRILADEVSINPYVSHSNKPVINKAPEPAPITTKVPKPVPTVYIFTTPDITGDRENEKLEDVFMLSREDVAAINVESLLNRLRILSSAYKITIKVECVASSHILISTRTRSVGKFVQKQITKQSPPIQSASAAM